MSLWHGVDIAMAFMKFHGHHLGDGALLWADFLTEEKTVHRQSRGQN